MTDNISLKGSILPYENIINEWINENEICKHDDKKSDLVWDIIKCIYDSDIGVDDFKDILHICSTNNIEIVEGNMWEYLKKYFKDIHMVFLKCIFNKCPRALSTSPNADCGKCELLYRLLRPNSRQPSKGDIIDNEEEIEIKGSEVRFFGEKGGKQYIKETNKLFEDLGGGIIGKSPKTGGLKGKQQYEIEKSQYREHYGPQFCKDIPKSKNLLKQYFLIHDINYSDSDIEEMFKHNRWNQSVLQNLWLKKMFLLTLNGADKMIIVGDGRCVKILKNTTDIDKITIYADYFRINQNANVGYYVK